MPPILSRYLLGELVRVFGLTLVVLVTVIAFGAAIKPMIEDQLMSAAMALKYVLLATIPMLEFALPFAAGFAATLTLHRFTTDNEILAASVSGISYARILAPIAALGLVLLAMVVLTQWVVPRFWDLMRLTIATDVTMIFERAIARGEPFQAGNVQIYADGIAVLPDPPDSGADTRIVLRRGVAAELDRDGRIITDVSFHQAVADLYRLRGRTLINLVMSDTVAYNGRTQQLMEAPQIRPDRPFEVEHALEDDPLLMTRGELLELRRDPDGFSRVRRARAELAEALRDDAVWAAIDETLRSRGVLRLEREGPDAVAFDVEAGGLEHDAFVPAQGRALRVVEHRRGVAMRRYSPDSIALQRTGSWVLAPPSLDLLLSACEVEDVGSRAVNRRGALSIAGLRIPQTERNDYDGWSSARLLEHAQGLPQRSAAVQQKLDRLRSQLKDLDLQIIRRFSIRYAMCATAPLLLLLGASLAIWLRESLPLVIYVWAFLPSVGNLILISGGDQIMPQNLLLGQAVLWSGNVVLLGFLMLACARMSRH